jgi:hypothetical protein
MKNQFIQTSLMFSVMLGISANLYAENLSATDIADIQRQEATSQYKAYLPTKYTVFEVV